MCTFSLWVLVISFSLFGCSLLQPNRPSRGAQAGPEVRDVPMQARGLEAGLRQRILVLPFLEEKVGSNAKILEQARAAVVRGLLRSGQFVVIDENDFPEDPKKYLTPEGDYDLSSIAKKLMPMGISAVLEGKIMQIRARRAGDSVGIFRKVKAEVTSNVRLRMYSAGNAKELVNEMYKASVDSEATQVLKRGYSEAELVRKPFTRAKQCHQGFYEGLTINWKKCAKAQVGGASCSPHWRKSLYQCRKN
jgi:hypothetical protein